MADARSMFSFDSEVYIYGTNVNTFRRSGRHTLLLTQLLSQYPALLKSGKLLNSIFAEFLCASKCEVVPL